MQFQTPNTVLICFKSNLRPDVSSETYLWILEIKRQLYWQLIQLTIENSCLDENSPVVLSICKDIYFAFNCLPFSFSKCHYFSCRWSNFAQYYNLHFLANRSEYDLIQTVLSSVVISFYIICPSLLYLLSNTCVCRTVSSFTNVHMMYKLRV